MTKDLHGNTDLAPDILGVLDIRSGEQVSDDSLREIFSIASERNGTVKFMRLGGPRRFRSDVIAFTTETGDITPGIKMLLDRRIKEIEFLLVNPFSEPFLTRMDAERKSNWDIWRVQEQVMDFSRGLLRVSEQRLRRGLSEVKLAFHSGDLVWNLGIANDEYVVVRAYFESATGHDDKISEIHLQTGRPSRLAESLISYYKHVRSEPATYFVHAEDDLASIGTWPSLFKGNAVLNPSDNSKKWVEKSCRPKFCDEAETSWLSFNKSEAPSCSYFQPARRERGWDRTAPWRGRTSCISRVEGITASEMLWHLQRIGIDCPDIVPKLEIVAGSIVYQAFCALQEFRKIGENVEQLKSKMRTYPWAQKLRDALTEAGRFVTDDHRALEECRQQAEQLARDLEKHASLPFRDAHLKNRMIEIDKKRLNENTEEFCEWLDKTTPNGIFEWLRQSTRDIDFETALWLVGPWDDPLHILWSNSLGFNQAQDFANGLGLLEIWWSPPQSSAEQKVFWATLLCRSLREYCRRLWYDHVMPATYQSRYHIERRDHFLELALTAADQLEGYTAIKVFLEMCHSHSDRIWRFAVKHQPAEPVIAKMPSPLLEEIRQDLVRKRPEKKVQAQSQKLLIELRQAIDSYFDESELRTLCFDLNQDYGNVPGRTKEEKAMELVSLYERRGKLPELVQAVRKARPNIPWNDEG